MLKIKLCLQKNAKFSRAWGFAPRPPKQPHPPPPPIANFWLCACITHSGTNERTIYFVLLLTSIINKTLHQKYSKRQQGCCEVTGLGSSSQAVILKAKASTLQKNTNNGALLNKAVNIKKKKLQKSKTKKKTTGTAVEKQVKKKIGKNIQSEL